ncbi:HxlR family transcriptional regulator [Paenibacillus macquariensis subsp. defensor]|nr:HxlR family transcriptional regulator [Paenibacillus macquariensis subsp. defensor]
MTALSLLWVTLIVHILMEEPKRFSQIHNFIPDLSIRMLNERIKKLEELGIINRNVIIEHPIRIEYSLRKGTELGRTLNAVENWAMKWL